ncbi:10960_t:CDS:2, partial [Entrophospora sp. SA101]
MDTMEIDAVNSSYLQQPQEQINHLQHQPHSRINERMPGKCIVDLAEMMKIFRKYYLFDKLKIITFPIRDDVMKSKFSETIYASPDFMSKKTVFIFIHDMADFRANTMAMTNSFEVSGSYM